MARLGALAVLALTLLGATMTPVFSPSKSAIIARRGWIKILLRDGVSSLQVDFSGPVRVVTASGTVAQEAGAPTLDVSSGTAGVSVVLGTKKLAEAAMVALEPQSPASGGWFQTGGKRYRGRLLLVSRGRGMEAIEQVQIEDWLKGVLPKEIGEESPPEALKAQAVAARSEAVRKLLHPPHASQGYDFCAGEHCQAYGAMACESPAPNQAVEATYGIVLTAGGEVIDAVYHDVCGGITAPAEDIWESPEQPGLHAVLDLPGTPRTIDLSSESVISQFLSAGAGAVFCEPTHAGYPSYARKYFRWQKTLDAQQLAKCAGVGRVKDIAVTERRKSGRVRKLTVMGDGGSKTFSKELPIRNAFDLWSGLFVLRVEKDGAYVRSVTFVGGGHGHGAGLCQMGARSMATSGLGFDKILAHYYVGTQLERIYRP